MLRQRRAGCQIHLPRLILSVTLLICSVSFLVPVSSQENIDSHPSKLEPLLTVKSDIADLEPVSSQYYPHKIIIPGVDIHVVVKPAKIINGYWEVPTSSAGFGLGSALPGQAGNTVIFAHAQSNLFLPLKKITPGQQIYILTQNSWYEYKVDIIKEVNPSDVSVVSKSTDSKLTLYTCSGFQDVKRLVVIATPV